ncbi:MAG: citrate/2-methylcitrate synthase [Asticcacaulis sp.]
MTRHWITRTEALQRLDVKAQTLYAYVSRRRIAARPDPVDPRRSLYAADDVERIAGRSGGRAIGAPPVSLSGGGLSRGEAALDTEISVVLEGRVYFRSQDATRLAEEMTLETVAALLWGCDDENPFATLKPRPDVSFPGGPRARALAMLARRADEDAAAHGRVGGALQREAASVLNEMVDAITGGGPRLFLHQRLGRVWKVQERDAHLIRRALVLSADHALDEATLAARVAASTHAPLATCALAALSTLSGPRLGGRFVMAENFVAEVRRDGNPHAVARRRLAEGQGLPGFEDGPDCADARATVLIAAAELSGDLKEILLAGEVLTGRPPSFALALALIARHLDLPREAAFAMFAVGRTAGWLAHAMEQITQGTPVRARFRYMGGEPNPVLASEAQGRTRALEDA